MSKLTEPKDRWLTFLRGLIFFLCILGWGTAYMADQPLGSLWCSIALLWWASGVQNYDRVWSIVELYSDTVDRYAAMLARSRR